MKNINTQSYSGHEELSQLLPWYVNNTLQGDELKAVEKHLTVCLTCKRELIQLQLLAQAVIQEGTRDTAERASFSRLKKRLHNEAHPELPQVRPEQTKTDNNVRQLRTRKQFWGNNAITRPALAMAAALLLTLSVFMPRYVDNNLQPDSSFRTLSDAQPEAIKANEIRVVFAENVNQEQKNIILDRVHGQFVGNNPTAQGVYTVRLSKDIATSHLLDVVDLLRKDNNVIFAEPAYALLSSTPMER